MHPIGKIKMRLEIDQLPSRLFEHARDWSDFAVSALLSTPVFYETEQRNISSSVIDSLERASDHEWILNIRHTDTQLTAHDICKQILRVRNAVGSALSLAGHFKLVRILNNKTLSLITRMKLATPNRLLCNPSFSAPINMIKAPTHFNDAPHHLIFPDGKEISIHAHELHSNGGKNETFFDISGPMTTAPENWGDETGRAKLHKFPLDILYALETPAGLSREDKTRLSQEIDRSRIADALHHMIVPKGRLTNSWTDRFEMGKLPITDSYFPHNNEATNSFSSTTRICYSSYTGNREMAVQLSAEIGRILGNAPELINVPYSELHSEKWSNAYKVILISSTWPHPAAHLTPFYFSSDSSIEFKQAYERSIASDDMSIAHKYALEAEDLLCLHELGTIILGQIIGCMRTSKSISWWPPSGWVYMHNLSPFFGETK